jgi:SAM-dependent methyltransferase
MTTERFQQDYWASEGEHWVREADRYDAMNRLFGEAMLDAVKLRPGERVLDVGCGNGATTLAAARQVAPGGEAIGVDLSAPMLALARHRADEAHCRNLQLLQADAGSHPFEDAEFDAVISRFGTMFFERPEVAFKNLHRALKSGGRLAMVCWRDASESEYIAVPAAAAAKHVGLPDFGPPDAPGPFALADQKRLCGIVEAAGFHSASVESITKPMRIADNLDDAVAFITSQPVVRDELFAGKPESNVRAAIAAAREALAPYEGPSGVVMSAGAWLVSLRR